MKAFYNENEPYAVEWLRNLEREGHVAPGLVDPRGIQELRPKDVEEAKQAHFFAGLGGWSYALRLAGWPDNQEVWTGSCPCQPFSTSGRKKGFSDERHLWPTWFKLIRKCRPGVIFGEQVGSPDGLKWLDLVLADLEGAGYAVAAADTCAAGVGAPHIRQRLYFVAIYSPGELGHSSGSRSGGHARTVSRAKEKSERERIVTRGVAHESVVAGNARKLGDTGSSRPPVGPGPEERFGAVRYEGVASAAPGATRGAWAEADWWLCRDGKARPAQPGAFPLADRAPARVGRLRATGNAIVPQQAALFIRAVMPLIGIRSLLK